MSDNSALYKRFYNTYKSSLRNATNGKVVQDNANVEWADAKDRFTDQSEFTKYIEQKINVYQVECAKQKVKFMSFFTQSNIVSRTFFFFSISRVLLSALNYIK